MFPYYYHHWVPMPVITPEYVQPQHMGEYGSPLAPLRQPTQNAAMPATLPRDYYPYHNKGV
jgi:hypothetical protein